MSLSPPLCNTGIGLGRRPRPPRSWRGTRTRSPSRRSRRRDLAESPIEGQFVYLGVENEELKGNLPGGLTHSVNTSTINTNSASLVSRRVVTFPYMYIPCVCGGCGRKSGRCRRRPPPPRVGTDRGRRRPVRRRRSRPGSGWRRPFRPSRRRGTSSAGS